MALWLIVPIAVAYVICAIDLGFIGGSWPLGLVFGGCAMVNIGLIGLMLPT